MMTRCHATLRFHNGNVSTPLVLGVVMLMMMSFQSPAVHGWSLPSFSSVDSMTRREAMIHAFVATTTTTWMILPNTVAQSSNMVANAADVTAVKKLKCTDIESCREIGESKIQQDSKDNPITRLDNGVSYKVLKPGIGGRNDGNSAAVVSSHDTVDLIFSINSNNRYMYSRGFGYEKVDMGGGILVKDDAGLDSYRVTLGTGKLPIGIETALVGMKRGERRRVVVPPNVGFETSNWQPEPRTFREKQTVLAYQRILQGNGSTQPPFAAPTIWDVEIVNFRK